MSAEKTRTAIARHGRQRARSAVGAVFGLLGGALAVVLVAGAAVGGVAYWQLTQNVANNAVSIPEDEGGAPPDLASYAGGFNIMIVGSDTREGQAGIGGHESSTLNDVNILLHVAQDQKSATLVSFPRDMNVPLPKCSKGGPASSLPINTAYYYGGLSCVVSTVQNLTGLKVQFAALTTFRGVINMSNAVGGVDVCIAGPIHDPRADLDIPKAGTYNFKGAKALALLRSRHGVGDGSDLGRISSQQVFLSALLRKVKSDGTLTDPVKLFSIAQTAINLTGNRNIVLSKNLAHVDTMVSLAKVLKDIPLKNIAMVQYPMGKSGDKWVPIKVQADALMAAIKKDRPIRLSADQIGGHGGSSVDPNAPKPTETASPDPSATPTLPGEPEDEGPKPITIPGLSGQNPDTYTCVQPYGT